MAGLGNTVERYGAVAMVLHWAMALLLVALTALGLYMVALPDVGFDTRKIELILYHKEIGMTVLLLSPLRLAWRITQVLPQLVAHLPEWQQVAARFVHLCFYALMIALPLTGWLMSSAAAIPVKFADLFTWPDLIGRDDLLFHRLIGIHQALAWALIALFAVHAGAALRHHFAFHDDTLRRMLP